jgi:putative transcriptional regulator
MAIVRKTLDELPTERRTLDRAKMAAATDDDIRLQAIEDGEDSDASLGELELVIPVHVVRRKLGMSQAEFAKAFHIRVGTIRNSEQKHVKPDLPPSLCRQSSTVGRKPRSKHFGRHNEPPGTVGRHGVR